MDIKHCTGCEDDFYNHRAQPGFDGATKCWNLRDAKLIKRKRVHVNQVPPWDQAAELYPKCYHAKQYIFVAETARD